MLSFTQKALEEFDNQHDFERMCADILNAQGYRDVTLVAPRGGSDGGRDITFTTESGGRGLACASLREDTETKFKEDFHQRKTGEYEKYYYFTNRYLTYSQKIKFAKYCVDTLNAELVCQDKEALRSWLDNSLQSIRKRYLHIDDQNSADVRKQITKILKYPATLSSTNFQNRAGFAEWILTTKTHREIYYFINEIDDVELRQIPLIGLTLHKFKEEYYNFCLGLDSFTTLCKEQIGTQTQTSFQFFNGWTMYFKYFLFRSFNNSQSEARQSVSLNYEITYDSCERVYEFLTSFPKIQDYVNNITQQRSEMDKLIPQLIEQINQANKDKF